MRVVFSRRALRNVDRILADSRRVFGGTVADELERYISRQIEQIAHAPESAPRAFGRANVRALSLVRYPFRIFYRVREDALEIVHVRHTSRRPWESR